MKDKDSTKVSSGLGIIAISARTIHFITQNIAHTLTKYGHDQPDGLWIYSAAVITTTAGAKKVNNIEPNATAGIR